MFFFFAIGPMLPATLFLLCGGGAYGLLAALIVGLVAPGAAAVVLTHIYGPDDDPPILKLCFLGWAINAAIGGAALTLMFVVMSRI